MQRTLLFLATFLFVCNAQAEWVSLGRNNDFRVFVDQKSIQRNGDFALVWQLMDFTTSQWVDERTVVGSIKNLIEFDCTQPRSRTLAAEAYSEQMENGRIVAHEQLTDPQWDAIEPGGTGEKMQKFACEKK